MGGLHQGALGGRGGGVPLGQHLLQRAQHEGERGAELVGDVGEEGGLHPVQLGERLDPLPLVLVGLRVHHRARDLGDDQVEEALVAVVVEPVGIEPGDEDAGAGAFARRRERQGHGERRRPVPGAPGQLADRREVGDEARLAGGQHFLERPRHRPPEIRHLGRGGITGVEAGGAREGHAAALRVEQVDEGEGQVARAGLQRLGTQRARLLDGAAHGGAGGQLAQQREPPLAQDADGVVGVGAEDPAGAALVVRHRAVGEGEVGLLGVAVAVHDEEERLVVGALVPLEGGGGPGTDVVPDLPPHLARGLAQRARVLAAEDGPVRVVVEIGEPVAPPDEHRLAGGEHDADGGLEGARPAVHRAEGRSGPVVAAHELAQLTAAGEEILGGHRGYSSATNSMVGVVAAVLPGDADVAGRLVEGAGHPQLAVVEALAGGVAGRVVVQRGGGGDGEVEALGAAGPADGAGDGDRAAGERLVDLQRRLGVEADGPVVLHRRVGETGEGAHHLEVGDLLQAGGAAGQGDGAVPGDGVVLVGVVGAQAEAEAGQGDGGAEAGGLGRGVGDPELAHHVEVEAADALVAAGRRGEGVARVVGHAVAVGVGRRAGRDAGLHRVAGAEGLKQARGEEGVERGLDVVAHREAHGGGRVVGQRIVVGVGGVTARREGEREDGGGERMTARAAHGRAPGARWNAVSIASMGGNQQEQGADPAGSPALETTAGLPAT